MSLSESEKKIAEYLFNTDISDLSADKIASDLFVSRTTIYRVCKKLGYSSFSHFKFEHMQKQNTRLVLKDVNSLDIFEYVDETSLMSIIEKIDRSNRVFIFGIFATCLASKYLTRQMINLGYDATCVEDEFLLEKLVPHITKDDVIICLSNSGVYLPYMYQSLDKMSATKIAVTQKNSPLTKICDYSLTFEFTHTKTDAPFDRENIFNLIVISQKILINLKERQEKQN